MAWRTLTENGWVYDDPKACTICGTRNAKTVVDGDPACNSCANWAETKRD